jgi:hypothetical protein
MLCPKKRETSKTGVKVHKREFWNNLCQHFVSRCSPSHHKRNQINGMQQCVMNTVSHSNGSESSPAPLCEPQTLHYTPLWGGYSIRCLVIKKSTNHERAPFHSSCAPCFLQSHNFARTQYHIQTDLSLHVKRLLVHKLPVWLKVLKSHKQLFVHVQGAQCKLQDCIRSPMLSF